MVAFVARQLGIDTAVLGTGSDRPQTRREQLAELMRHGGFRGFGRAEARDLVAWLTPVTQANRKPGQLAILLVEELRRRRILLPTPRVLELVIHHARIRAERALHRAMIDGINPIQLAALDALLAVPAGGGGLSRIARLRQAPNAPPCRMWLCTTASAPAWSTAGGAGRFPEMPGRRCGCCQCGSPTSQCCRRQQVVVHLTGRRV